MAESNMTLKYHDFVQAVGFFLGWGMDDLASPAGWMNDVTDLAFVDMLVQNGIRRFYYPPVTDGEKEHIWSFFKPVRTITVWPTTTYTASKDGANIVTATDGTFYPSMVGRTIAFPTNGTDYVVLTYTDATHVVVTDAVNKVIASEEAVTVTATGGYRLPDDFEGIEGDLTFGQAEAYAPAVVTSEQQIRKLWTGGGTGRTSRVAVWPLEATGADAQRYELLTYPIPSAVYELHYTTNIKPIKLTAELPYPLGATQFSDAIRQGCLAAAEEEIGAEDRTHEAKFMTLLASAMTKDRGRITAENLGYNSDNSDGAHRMPGRYHRHNSVVSIVSGGVTYP